MRKSAFCIHVYAETAQLNSSFFSKKKIIVIFTSCGWTGHRQANTLSASMVQWLSYSPCTPGGRSREFDLELL